MIIKHFIPYDYKDWFNPNLYSQGVKSTPVLVMHWTGEGEAIYHFELNLWRDCRMPQLLFKNGPFPASFSLFSSFQYSWQLINIQYKSLLMTGLEPRISGVGSNRSTNWATTTAPQLLFRFLIFFKRKNDSMCFASWMHFGDQNTCNVVNNKCWQWLNLSLWDLLQILNLVFKYTD